MSGPWEKYRAQAPGAAPTGVPPAPVAGPWDRHRTQGAQPPEAVAPPAAEPAPAVPAPTPERGFVARLGEAATGIVNDIGAAFQGVNPIAVAEQTGQAVGVLRDEPGIGQYVDVDGAREPIDRYPPDQYVTRVEPSNGLTYIYPRTDENAASRLESAGRAAGYGVISQLPKALAATPKPEGFREAAQALDITPSFAMQNKPAAVLAAGGEQLVTTAGPFGRDGARVTGEIADAANRIADKAGPGASAVEAGAALQRGANTFVANAKKVEDGLWGEVDRIIPKKTAVAAPETSAFLRQEIEALAGSPEIAKSLGNDKIAKWLADVDAGLTWEAARKFRTSIGEAIGDIKGPIADVAEKRLQAIYGKLSTDLEATAQSLGPEAAAAVTRANDYTRAKSARIETALSQILKADSPERAYEGFIARARTGTARSNITDMQRAFRSIPKDEQAVVAGTIIRGLGEAAPGAQNAAGDAFSAAGFLTNWNKLAPEAREIIARNGLEPGVMKDLDRLALVIERAKVAGGQRNMSNTAGAAGVSALTAGLMAAPISTTAFAGLSHMGARLLTNPTLLRAVNQFYAGNPARLRSIAAGNTPLAIEAATILRLEGQTSAPPAPSAPAPAASWSTP